ncbi:MAG TPA: lipoyl(octanoyl) transferase LipB [Candidatus Acidoferrum sp.]|nr:lipoyl(octanoyl) transferase LipB [Candidatus Acidoferrum sp.]
MTSDRKNPNFTGGAGCEREASTSHESPVTGHRNSPCLTIDLGLIGYAEAYALQKRVVAARKAGAIDDVLLLCEHPHVITQGRNGKREHLLAGENVLRQKGISLYETSRGGDITYHGPGQIVGYPILNLAAIRRDVVWYVRMLEEVMLRASADFGVNAIREPGKTGIWVSAENSLPREKSISEKLGAIGVHISRWVTSHGFAYNVSTDLRFFDLIIPCGIAGRKATSLEKLLNRRVNSQEVAVRLTHHFGQVFAREMQSATPQEFLQRLEACEQAREQSSAPLKTPATEATAQPQFAALPATEIQQPHR